MPQRRVGAFALLLVSAGGLYFTLMLKQWKFENLYPQISPENISLQETDSFFLAKSFPSSSISSNDKCSSGSVMYEKYCVLSPFENYTRNAADLETVTLCTQGTVEFLHHVIVLCHRWSAPVSVAVYCPENDYVDARYTVDLLRDCNECVRAWVNWHFILLEKKMPEIKESRMSENCSSITHPREHKVRRSQDTYPINVARNVARKLTHTPFVFSIDIELYPSLHIPIKFERMLLSSPPLNFDRNNQVWVVPVFEVYPHFQAPLTKSHLREMFRKGHAISFHRFRCNLCHRIPNLTQWINHEVGTKDEIDDSLESMKIWSTVKRSKSFKLQNWEPFFIGRREDPEFDIRLSWEGKQNKMQVAYEMCMKDYNFHIIENAFLVHTPGINVYNASKEKFRNMHTKANSRIIWQIKRDLTKRYKSKKDC